MRDIDTNFKVNLVFFQKSLEAWLARTLHEDTLSNPRNVVVADLLVCLQDLSNTLVLVHSAFNKFTPKIEQRSPEEPLGKEIEEVFFETLEELV